MTSGDVLFCEHVSRTEPERLLPPIAEIKDAALHERDYQYLVDTIHFDSDEGVQYKVLRVYRQKALIVVDRELFDQDKPSLLRRTLDTIHLRDAIAMPLMAGPINPAYRSVGLTYGDDGPQQEPTSSSAPSKAARSRRRRRGE